MYKRTQHNIKVSRLYSSTNHTTQNVTPYYIQMKIGGNNFRSNKTANMAIKHTLNNENKYTCAKETPPNGEHM
jgi:hypothetical protein